MLYKIIDIKISEDKGIILTTHEEDEVVLQSVSKIFEI